LNRISLTKDLALVLGAPLPSHILPQASQVDDYQGADESLRLALLMKKCCIILASFSMFLLHREKLIDRYGSEKIIFDSILEYQLDILKMYLNIKLFTKMEFINLMIFI